MVKDTNDDIHTCVLYWLQYIKLIFICIEINELMYYIDDIFNQVFIGTLKKAA